MTGIYNLTDKELLTIETGRLILKTLLPEDVTSAYVQGVNDPDVYRFLLLPDKGKQTKQSIKTYAADNLKSSDSLLFGIHMNDENGLIGTTRLSGISLFHYCCDIGVCIFSKGQWGKGFAREAVREVVKFAFENLGMHYIEAGVFSENASSINLFLKSGFQMRNSYNGKLRLRDRFAEVTILYAINADFDYGKLKPSDEF